MLFLSLSVSNWNSDDGLKAVQLLLDTITNSQKASPEAPNSGSRQTLPPPRDALGILHVAAGLPRHVVLMAEKLFQKEVRKPLRVMAQDGVLLDQVIEDHAATHVPQGRQVHHDGFGAFRAIAPHHFG